MKWMKKAVAAILAVVMAASMLLMSGCSTPKVAMTVDGVEYTTGEYLAALYQTYYQMYYQNGLYQYAAYGTDVWTQTYPYGDANEQLLLADYMVRATKDNIIRQTAVAKLMKQYGITVNPADLAEYQASFADVDDKEMLKYGFNKQSYMRMNMATMEEQELFYTLYGEGGQRAVAAEKVREHFEKSFVAYKAITISQMDGSGNALTDEEKTKNKEKLDTYLALYNELKDMDAVIEKYTIDEKAEESTTDSTATTPTTGDGTTTSGDAAATTTTTTTAAPTTTTTTTTTTAAAETTTTAADGATTTTTTGAGTEGETEAEEAKEPNMQFLNSVEGDEKIVEAVLTVNVGEAKIVEYTDSNGTDYIALVYRYDVEEAATLAEEVEEGEEYYNEDRKNLCIFDMKYEEFDAEVKKLAKSLPVEYNDRAIKACDVMTFVEIDEEEAA